MFELIDFLIVNPIVNILFVIYNFVGDFGIAIILFTIIIKCITWPITKRQLRQTKLIRKIQPELTEIRKRCNGNKQLESIQMMDLYKRNNIKPARSIWTLFIQLPIFFALFLAIRVMVTPLPTDYVEKRAYPAVANLDRIKNIVDIQKPYLDYVNNMRDGDDSNNPAEEVTYDFNPKLFNIVDLSVNAGFGNKSSILILIFALTAAFIQYLTAKQQTSTNKDKKSAKSSWSKLMADAKEGKDVDQSEINNMVSGQMTFMMPLMMLMIMISLPGAIVFYYMFSYMITFGQQRIILNKVDDDMDDSTDRAILKELKNKTKGVKEAEVVVNKKTGTKITRISAKDAKNKYSKTNHTG